MILINSFLTIILVWRKTLSTLIYNILSVFLTYRAILKGISCNNFRKLKEKTYTKGEEQNNFYFIECWLIIFGYLNISFYCNLELFKFKKCARVQAVKMSRPYFYRKPIDIFNLTILCYADIWFSYLRRLRRWNKA